MKSKKTPIQPEEYEKNTVKEKKQKLHIYFKYSKYRSE